METATEEISVLPKVQTINVGSFAFEHNGFIPAKYTCDGENVNPPLWIGDFPKGTKSLVLIIDDNDSPVRMWNHWIVWNIPPVHIIKEASVPGTEGINDFCINKYNGPCLPFAAHRYVFKVYALNKVLDLQVETTEKDELEKAMNPYIIGYGELIGLYERA
jgi:Raf kinase inhibitor-like YbhB/YbcL family protein